MFYISCYCYHFFWSLRGAIRKRSLRVLFVASQFVYITFCLFNASWCIISCIWQATLPLLLTVHIACFYETCAFVCASNWGVFIIYILVYVVRISNTLWYRPFLLVLYVYRRESNLSFSPTKSWAARSWKRQKFSRTKTGGQPDYVTRSGEHRPY